MKAFAAAALGFVLSVQAGFAAEPVFPPASRIGLVPPEDMVVSKRFSGFENPEKATAINFVEMPAEAYEPAGERADQGRPEAPGHERDLAREPEDRHADGNPDRRHHDRAGERAANG